MSPFPCDECRAIYNELREAHREAAEPQPLDVWLRNLDEGECTHLRAHSPFWKAWRRLQEHRARTGHMLSVLPIPPGALSNPN